MRKEGLEGRIRAHIVGYRSMPKCWNGSFGRLDGVETMGAVGCEYMDIF